MNLIALRDPLYYFPPLFLYTPIRDKGNPKRVDLLTSQFPAPFPIEDFNSASKERLVNITRFSSDAQ